MALKLTLRANEVVVVNGCVIRNSDRRHVLMVENKADVVRGQDLLDERSAATPVTRAYFLIQTALIRPETREKIVPVIQSSLADLAGVFGPTIVNKIFEAAGFVSTSDYYKALSVLRPVIRHETQVFERINSSSAQDVPPMENQGPVDARHAVAG